MNPYCPYFYLHHFGPSFGQTLDPTGSLGPLTQPTGTPAILRQPVRNPFSHWQAYRDALAQRMTHGDAIDAALAAGFLTPVRVSTAGFGPVFHASLYGLVPQPDGQSYDLHVAARPAGDATNLLANFGGAQVVNVTGTGPVRLYPVAWVDAPGGAIWGWMADGSFTPLSGTV
jgi:hypothetical protein